VIATSPDVLVNTLSAVAHLTRRGLYDRAADEAKALARRYPRDPRPWAELAHALVAAGRREQGLHAIKRFERLSPNTPASLNLTGRLYSLADLPARALPFFRRAAEAQPQNGRYVYDLAAAQRMTGAIDLAQKTVQRAIDLDPSNTEALWVRSDLRQATPQQNNIEDLERRLSPALAPEAEVFIRYALVRECEEAGEWARAFSHLERGAALRRQGRSYSVGRDVAGLEALRRHQNRGAVAAAGPGSNDPRPIFVVGLPRTGTTLVERVLSGHPKVRSIGESWAFDRTLLDLARAAGLDSAEGTLARGGLGLSMVELGDGYCAAASYGMAPKLRWVDKQPRNYLNIAMIRAALPRAGLVLVDRSPMDACWAIYKTLFRGDSYQFSADLIDLAEYYAAWRRLTNHWLDAFGETMVHVRYEALVQTFSEEARRLTAGCGLDWTPSCLAFHKSPTPSSTASAVQIRRPVYTSSVGLWRRYAAQLEPLAERLRALGVEVD